MRYWARGWTLSVSPDIAICSELHIDRNNTHFTLLDPFGNTLRLDERR